MRSSGGTQQADNSHLIKMVESKQETLERERRQRRELTLRLREIEKENLILRQYINQILQIKLA
jgi:hypothetical protein